jgi:hypothetical protein
MRKVPIPFLITGSTSTLSQQSFYVLHTEKRHLKRGLEIG